LPPRDPLGEVAVAVGARALLAGGHLRGGEGGVGGEGAKDEGALCFHLSGVGEVLQIAPAARSKVRAAWILTVRGGRLAIDEAREGLRALAAHRQDAADPGLPGEGAFDVDGALIDLCDAFAAGA